MFRSMRNACGRLFPRSSNAPRSGIRSLGGSMRLSSLMALAVVLALATPRAQAVTTGGGESDLKVVLLGTMGGPSFSGERLGISTLVIAGDQMLLFDAGRSLTTGLARLNKIGRASCRERVERWRDGGEVSEREGQGKRDSG